MHQGSCVWDTVGRKEGGVRGCKRGEQEVDHGKLVELELYLGI